jgi:tRNA nucleotidyltransferase (CCA-adding enzyme)
MKLLREAPGAEIVFEAIAGEERVFVVGGAVRDALLGRVPKELDLVVEGDALPVARRAAERVRGALLVHERFGTATITADGFSFDVASARQETYPRPGMLPEVTLGATIEQDLARRDFTINAIAFGLDDEELVEWPGARQDLEDRVLRVLHERSFRDDPTRMLRLIRYAARLKFNTHADTRRLIDPRLTDTVTGDRLGNELRLLAEEPPAALFLLERTGLGAKLLGRRFAVADYGLRGPLALAACVTRVPREELTQRLDHLGFRASERHIIVAAATAFERLHGNLDVSDAELWRLLRRERPETAELLAAAGDAGAQRWLDDVRHRRLEITGADLIAQGLTGAAVGQGLAAATVAMLEGKAQDREAQLEAARAEAATGSDPVNPR